MKLEIDHFVVGIDSLETGVSWASSALGVKLQAGGSHEGRGTCNALAGLGPQGYLEVLARDPKQLAEPILKLPVAEPRLLHWCIRSDDLAAVEQRAIGLGLTSMGISDWQRQTPSGDRLRWKLLFLGGVEGAGVLPFFIDWCGTPTPASSLPVQAEVLSFLVSTPHATRVNKLINSLDMNIRVAVQESDRSQLRIELKSLEGKAETLSSDEAYLGGLLDIASRSAG